MKWPIFSVNDQTQIESVLTNGFITEKNLFINQSEINEKSFINQFENNFCEYLSSKFGVLAPNGTIALSMALLASGITENDLVAVPSHTWVSTATSVLLINAIPVIVDVNSDDLLLSSVALEKAFNKYKKIKSVIAVHLNGFMCDMDKIKEICERKNVILIEDCAQSIGSSYHSRKAGTIGHCGIFSFQESKVLTCGEGGFVCTDSEKIYKKLILYRDLTRIKDTGYMINRMYLFGSNYRFNEFLAAILCSQYQRFYTNFDYKEKLMISDINSINKLRFLSSFSLTTAQDRFSFFRVPILVEIDKLKLYKELMANSIPVIKAPPLFYSTLLFSVPKRIEKKMKYKNLEFTSTQNIVDNLLYIHHSYYDSENCNSKLMRILREHDEYSAGIEKN